MKIISCFILLAAVVYSVSGQIGAIGCADCGFTMCTDGKGAARCDNDLDKCTCSSERWTEVLGKDGKARYTAHPRKNIPTLGGSDAVPAASEVKPVQNPPICFDCGHNACLDGKGSQRCDNDLDICSCSPDRWTGVLGKDGKVRFTSQSRKMLESMQPSASETKPVSEKVPPCYDCGYTMCPDGKGASRCDNDLGKCVCSADRWDANVLAKDGKVKYTSIYRKGHEKLTPAASEAQPVVANTPACLDCGFLQCTDGKGSSRCDNDEDKCVCSPDRWDTSILAKDGKPRYTAQSRKNFESMAPAASEAQPVAAKAPLCLDCGFLMCTDGKGASRCDNDLDKCVCSSDRWDEKVLAKDGKPRYTSQSRKMLESLAPAASEAQPVVANTPACLDCGFLQCTDGKGSSRCDNDEDKCVCSPDRWNTTILAKDGKPRYTSQSRKMFESLAPAASVVSPFLPRPIFTRSIMELPALPSEPSPVIAKSPIGRCRDCQMMICGDSLRGLCDNLYNTCSCHPDRYDDINSERYTVYPDTFIEELKELNRSG